MKNIQSRRIYFRVAPTACLRILKYVNVLGECMRGGEKYGADRFQGTNRRKKTVINNGAYLFLHERYVWNGDIRRSEFFEESDT